MHCILDFLLHFSQCVSKHGSFWCNVHRVNLSTSSCNQLNDWKTDKPKTFLQNPRSSASGSSTSSNFSRRHAERFSELFNQRAECFNKWKWICWLSRLCDKQSPVMIQEFHQLNLVNRTILWISLKFRFLLYFDWMFFSRNSRCSYF